MDAHSTLSAAAADSEHGATHVALDAAEGLAALAREQPEPDQFARAFLEAARTLLLRQRTMAPIWRLVNDCLLAADAAPGPELASDAVTEAARSFAARARRARSRIVHELAQLVPAHTVVLTTSASSTLEAAFVALAEAGRVRRLMICRADPGAEGAALAERLRARRVPAERVDDAAVGLAARVADLIVIGADAAGPDWCVNKVGSLPLALVAESSGRRAIVTADTTKLVPRDLATAIAAGMDTDPARARFETVPWRHVEGWVSEEGFLPARSVSLWSEGIEVHERLASFARELATDNQS
ncbi:MAG: hypothetical protein IT198_10535 [Acidimicrobiia bacterium]|nr:hypothetical protein [Acidimicrobiia bacterium]